MVLTTGPASRSVVAAPATSAAAAASASSSPYLIKAGQGAVLPPSVEDAEAFCALALACLDIAMFPPAPDFQGCVNGLMNQLTSPEALNTSLTIRECGLRATSCKTLRTCALKSADPTICKDVAMDTKSPVGKCDMDGRAVQCWRGKVLGVRNCTLANELCVAKGGQAECALAGACPAGVKDTWSCAGTRMVRCQDNKFLSIDCSVLNLSCVNGPGADGKPTVGCAPTSTKSCTKSELTCSGKDAVGCVYGKEVSVACGEQGMKCSDPGKPSNEMTVGVCELPAVDKPCDPKTFKATCKGSAVEYCSHGSLRAFQCKGIGATKCVTDKSSGPRCTG
ncbi:MAG: hypothetical protein NVS3B10_31260 [Polyangiales bacterium]